MKYIQPEVEIILLNVDILTESIELPPEDL